MKLDQKEARLIAELRATSTGKVTAVKFNGEIRAIKTEIDAEISDRAKGLKEPWKEATYGSMHGETVLPRKVIRISEPMKPAPSLENMEETTIREHGSTGGV